jgi:hypothetical protein
MDIVVVLCAGPPILTVFLCFCGYAGFRRAIGRERVEAGCLAEELCILIGKGQLDRAQSRVRLIATSTCKLIERERQAVQEQVLEALPDIYGLTNSPSSSPSACPAPVKTVG